MRVVDVHAHLSELEDLDGAIGRAAEAGVFAVVSVGMNLESNQRTLRIAEEHENSSVRILPALGLHPWGLLKEHIEPTIAQIKRHGDTIVGLGEVGLDYWVKEMRKDPAIREIQKLAFKEIVNLAKQSGKPITIHSRGAWQDCFDIVADSGLKNAIFHWYSGPLELLKRIVDRGFFVSATPAVAHSRDHRAAILETPLENLLIETDSPVKYGTLISEPKDVIMTLNEVSKLKGLTDEAVAEKTVGNFLNLYRLSLP